MKLFEIVSVVPYLTDYDENACSTIADNVEDIFHYNVIFIGFLNLEDDISHIVYILTIFYLNRKYFDR